MSQNINQLIFDNLGSFQKYKGLIFPLRKRKLTHCCNHPQSFNSTQHVTCSSYQKIMIQIKKIKRQFPEINIVYGGHVRWRHVSEF
jgi:hypothetical protein